MTHKIRVTDNVKPMLARKLKSPNGLHTKVRSCYHVSITSNQADKKSKNNNKIAGIAESVKHKKRQNSLVLKLKNDIK